MLKILDLESGYGKKQILNGISMEVKKGEIIAIIGHNGAGKSTLLKSIFGLIPVWKGDVYFNSISIVDQKSVDNVKNGMSFLMQGNRVFTELTVLENLQMGGYLLKSKSVIQTMVSEVFDLFPELVERKKQVAGTLSGGEQQQLALGNALMGQPRMLLLDEPSLGLSSKNVKKTLQTIQNLNQKLGTSILVVEQKVREILKIAHRVYVLKLGKVAFEGKPEELLKGERLRDVYLA